MRWGKDLLCWAHDMIRKEMSWANKNIVQSLHFFFLLFFCNQLKIGKAVMNWKCIYKETCHIFGSAGFPIIFLLSV